MIHSKGACGRMGAVHAGAPRVLVFQHIEVEHPGVFRDFLHADGIEWTTVQLDTGASIPDLGDYHALWVMGGPMDVWEDAAYPWLARERAAIREAVLEHKMPFLGFCLGHQLLAQVLGGEVAAAVHPEVGIHAVQLTAAGRASSFYAGLPEVHACLQWHGAEVVRTPPGARTLAYSRDCGVQAMGYAEHAFSIQYHVEPTEDMVSVWGGLPAYARLLERVSGAGAQARLEAAVSARLGEFNRSARCIYDNFMQRVRCYSSGRGR